MFKVYLLLALVFGLSGDSPTEKNSNSELAIHSSQLPTLVVSIYNKKDVFLKGLTDVIVQNSIGRIHVELLYSYKSRIIERANIASLNLNKTDVLAINPVDRTATSMMIEQARMSNLPIIIFNREPLAEDLSRWHKAYYVGAKAEQSGTMQGEILAEYFLKCPEMDKNKDGVLQFVILKGEPGHQDAELRTKFSVKAIKEAGIKVVKLTEDHANWESDAGEQKMKKFLAEYGDNIEAVIANNDEMALGAIKALKSAGYFKDYKYMPVVGVDATAQALEALSDGTLLGTVINDVNLQGKAVINLAMVLARGENPNMGNIGHDVIEGKYVWVPYRKMVNKVVSGCMKRIS